MKIYRRDVCGKMHITMSTLKVDIVLSPKRQRLRHLFLVYARNRPDIRQSPVPAGYPAPFSGSGSGPAEENFAGFLPENVCLFENLFS